MINQRNVLLVATAVALFALLSYTFVHTGAFLARFIEPFWVGYAAALGIEASVVALSLRIGELKKHKQNPLYYYSVLVAVVIVSALANLAEGFAVRYGETLTIETAVRMDPFEAVLLLSATALLSAVVLFMSEVVGTDAEQVAKLATKTDDTSAKLRRDLAGLRQEFDNVSKDYAELEARVAFEMIERDRIPTALMKIINAHVNGRPLNGDLGIPMSTLERIKPLLKES